MRVATSLLPGLLQILILGLCLGAPAHLAAADPAPAARVLKVLPHYLDLQGRHMISPSLFDRDAYQFELRSKPEKRSGLRMDVLWKTPPGVPAALTLKVELRGSRAPEQSPVILTQRVFSRGGFSQWTRVPVVATNYAALGELLAWKVSLLQDDQVLSSQQSFLW